METNTAASILNQTTPQVPAAPAADPVQAQPQTPQGAKDERVSGRIEALIKREQAAIAREAAAKEREKSLESHLARQRDFDEAKKGNVKKALELLELNYDQLTEAMLRDGEIPPSKRIQELEAQIAELKQLRDSDKDEAEKVRKQEAEAQEQRAVSSFKKDINQYLLDNKARYELIEFEGQQELVFEVIDEHYKRTQDLEAGTPGKVMSIAEAADKVELYLEQKYQKAPTVSKIQTLWKGVPKGTLENIATPKAEPRPVQPPRTLTNNMSATQTQKKAPITDEERIRRAIAYANSLRPNIG